MVGKSNGIRINHLPSLLSRELDVIYYAIRLIIGGRPMMSRSLTLITLTISGDCMFIDHRGPGHAIVLGITHAKKHIVDG